MMDKIPEKYIIPWKEAETVLTHLLGVKIDYNRLESIIERTGSFIRLTEELHLKNEKDEEVLAYIEPGKNLKGEIYIITDSSYYKNIHGIFKIDAGNIVEFMDLYGNFFFEGDVYLICPATDKLFHFHYNECWFYYSLPLQRNENIKGE